jgi:hypothetical protein
MRVLACTFLALAAFAFVPPFLDRAGTAALGLAFLALALGGGSPVRRPALFQPRPHDLGLGLDDLEPVMAELSDRLAPYGAARGHADDAPR